MAICFGRKIRNEEAFYAYAELFSEHEDNHSWHENCQAPDGQMSNRLIIEVSETDSDSLFILKRMFKMEFPSGAALTFYPLKGEQWLLKAFNNW